MLVSAAARSRAGLALLTLVASGCVVSFDGYELGSSSGGSAGVGAIGGTLTGGTGGAVAGSGGTSTGGTSPTGGTGGTSPTGGTGGTSPTGGTGGTSPTGGTGGTSPTGGTGGSVPTGGTGGGFACPTVAGASGMVKITDGAAPYCIDSTEVTMKQYAGFLGITNKPPQSTECASNADYTPSSCGVTFNPGLDKPVVCVDWCDARAYCNAIGKRLCGKIGGGPLVAPADAANAAVSQWYRACSAAGAQDYPYGPAYAAKTCNGGESDFIGLQTVPVVACVSSAYPLLYDLSGNAAEWEDDCNASGCAVRGGHHLSLGPDLKCGAAPVASRTSVAKERGFRCCFD